MATNTQRASDPSRGPRTSSCRGRRGPRGHLEDRHSEGPCSTAGGSACFRGTLCLLVTSASPGGRGADSGNVLSGGQRPHTLSGCRRRGGRANPAPSGPRARPSRRHVSGRFCAFKMISNLKVMAFFFFLRSKEEHHNISTWREKSFFRQNTKTK